MGDRDRWHEASKKKTLAQRLKEASIDCLAYSYNPVIRTANSGCNVRTPRPRDVLPTRLWMIIHFLACTKILGKIRVIASTTVRIEP
jgi:hypothetical protein